VVDAATRRVHAQEGIVTDQSPGPHAAVWVDDLETEVCWRLLATQPIGRLAFVAEGVPHVYPLNHRVAGHSIVFRTADDAALGELVGGPVVAFEADDADASAETGWSVLAYGRLEVITDDAEVADLAALDVHAWAPGKDRWVRIRPDHVSGRAISRRRRADGSGEFVPYRP
jgi:nitroimidazol reductase NimA-like FMN-containing flavoprotein (pyridoxamine 5'-phosphate oxidase superfamily)